METQGQNTQVVLKPVYCSMKNLTVYQIYVLIHIIAQLILDFFIDIWSSLNLHFKNNI